MRSCSVFFVLVEHCLPTGYNGRDSCHIRTCISRGLNHMRPGVHASVIRLRFFLGVILYMVILSDLVHWCMHSYMCISVYAHVWHPHVRMGNCTACVHADVHTYIHTHATYMYIHTHVSLKSSLPPVINVHETIHKYLPTVQGWKKWSENVPKKA